jgi:hypothetical protein
MRARLSAVGVTGPRDRPTGVFVRGVSGGEPYVFTMTGNPRQIERLIRYASEQINDGITDGRIVVESGRDSGDRPLRGQDGESSRLARPGGYQGSEVDPRERRARDRTALHQHQFSITRRPDGLWSACVCIPTAGGNVYLCATADEHAVAQALHGELAAVSGNRRWTGNERFRRVCAEIGNARAMDRLGASARTFMGDPAVRSIFQSVVPLIPVVGPIASTAFNASNSAIAVVDRAEKGDPNARQAVARVTADARANKPGARQALEMLKQASVFRKQILSLQNERVSLQAKLRECGEREQERARAIVALKKNEEDLRRQIKKLEKRDEKQEEMSMEDDGFESYSDLWGGFSDNQGVDVVQGAGIVMGEEIGLSEARSLARPTVASYYRNRLPLGPVLRGESPEVAGIYHRPMRESSEASLRKDYLRGTGLQTAGFPVGRHFLDPNTIRAALRGR